MKAIRSAAAIAVLLASLLAVAVGNAPAASAAPHPGAADPDVRAWLRTGRPERLLVIRPHVVGLVDHGVVVRRLYPAPGDISLSWLAANAGWEWIGYEPNAPYTVRVRTAILLAPGTALRIDSRTRKVLMTAGTTAESGTWISGSRASLDIEDVTLTSVAPDGTAPAPAAAAGRPYLAMGAAGRMDIRRSTVTGFGRGGRSASAAQSGVSWGRGSTGSVTDSTFRGNHTGLRLAASTGVVMNKVTAEKSAKDGIVLKGDRGTVAGGLTAKGNGRTGISVSGTDDRTLTGFASRDNKGAGIKASDQSGLRLVTPHSVADTGGIKLINCAACTVVKAKVEGPTRQALSVSGIDSNVAVQDPDLDGGGSGFGLLLKPGIKSATVSGGKVRGFDRGIGITGTHVRVERTTVTHNRTGIAVGGYADRILIDGVRVSGCRNGITAFATTRHVTLAGIHVSGAHKGLVSASGGLWVDGGSVSGATTAVDLGASARLRRLTVGDTPRGVHLAPGVHATAEHLDVLSERRGIEADRGARMDLTDSRVRAPWALTGKGDVKRHGHTKVTLPPFPWLGFAALAALLLALLLQTVHQVRQRGTPRPKVAPHVRNTT